MSQAWAICPVCGKVVGIDPVDVPAEPVQMAQHRKEHARDPVPAPSAHAGRRAMTEGRSATARPAPAASEAPLHPFPSEREEAPGGARERAPAPGKGRRDRAS